MANFNNPNNQNNPINNEEDKYDFNFTPHKNFEPVGEFKFTTTKEIAEDINTMMKEVFDDYYGCSVGVTFNPALGNYVMNPVLFFKLSKDNDKDIVAFRPMYPNNKDSGMYERIARVSNTINTVGPKVEITDPTVEFIKRFAISPKSASKDIKSHFSTQVVNGNTLVRVFKLDILKFFKGIYGEEGSGDHGVFYQPELIRPMNANQQYAGSDNWAVKLYKIDVSEEYKAASKQGFNLFNNIGSNSNIVIASNN